MTETLTEIMARHRTGPRHRRHPVEVTSDRLAEHMERYFDRLTGADCDTLSRARYILEWLIEEEQL